MTKISILLFFFWLNTSLLAQGQEDVFPFLYGTEARTALANAYTPGNILNYNNARDTLFKNILGKNDSLTCVYSGHTVYMNPNEDPTVTVFQNGGTNGINTEHTWPQAFGAGSGNARSNMYHLFPTRISVNAARASFPFAEIPDAQTQTWYYLNQGQSSIPNNNIERYSESREGSFEPREDFKGDIARAMFYFYTIYNQEAGSAPAGFFSNQISTLYQWHRQDPVGQEEWERNQKIAPYQENKSNPYILDSTLVERVFCEELGLLCTPDAIRDGEWNPSVSFGVFPNPARNQATIQYTLPERGEVEIKIYNVLGQELLLLLDGKQEAGEYAIAIDRADVLAKERGLVFCRLEYWQGERIFVYIRKLLLHHY